MAGCGVVSTETTTSAARHPSVVLGSYAARSCAVKTHNAFDPTIDVVAGQPDDKLAELFEGGEVFEQQMVERLACLATGRVIDLRLADDLPAHIQSGATAEAVASGAELIIGGLLPRDPAHHRSGRPDVLLRGADRPDGRPGYHVVEIKMHKVVERRTKSVLLVSGFSSPAPADADELLGHGFRLSRDSDLIQLAHYQRMLADLGWAAPGRPFAGLIGTDSFADGPMITWMDLEERMLRTFSRSGPAGWTARSPLQRYDHEHAFRVDVARAAARQGEPDAPPPLVRPIVTDECSRCPWWDHCRSQLPDDDVSLRVGKGALDVREIAALRAGGISTIDQLAEIDLDQLLQWYLPEVTHRAGAEDRIRKATHRAKLIMDGQQFERISTGPIEVPEAELEIDFDIETTAEGLIYLWGFRTHHGRSLDGDYLGFADFTEPDADRERDLAVRALNWLREQAESAGSVCVYHYSGFEVAALQRLAEAYPQEPIFGWALGFAEDHFCDLLRLVKQNFFGVNGIGLKSVASGAAGFRWRDDDAGGLNSTRWFIDAAHGETAEQRRLARQRVLDYNEDDVIATARVRAWLRGR
jgi:predicted RecB family nuclease